MNTPKIRASLAGLKNQWGAGGAFQKAGFKKKLNSLPSQIAFVVLSCLLVLTILEQGGKEKEIAKSLISQPPPVGQSNQLTLKNNEQVPNLAPIGSNSNSDTAKHLKRRAPLYTLGPVIIMPENFGTVPAGTFIKAKLITGATNGPVKAQIEEPIYINGDLVAPIGATAMGEGSSTDERLLIHFTKIILKNGKLKFRAQAYDVKDQIVGLKGTKISSQALQVAGGVGLGFVGGLSEGLQEQSQINGVAVNQPSLKNAMLNGAATASLEESKQMLDKMREKKTVIEVPSQTEFYILVQEPPDQESANQ